jgi:peptide/nickel transport system permease protein
VNGSALAIGRNVGKRLLATAAMLLGTVVATFLLTHVVPANPAQIAAGLNAEPAQVAVVAKQLGLDKPLWQQLWIFLENLFQGKFGTSFVSHRDVSSDIANYFPATLELVVCAMIVTVVIAVPVGVYTALGRSRWLSGPLRALSFGSMGVPPFVIGLILQIVFFGVLGIFPSGGEASTSVASPPTVTGSLVIDSIIAGNASALGDALWHLVMPAAALAIPCIGLVVRYTESEVRRAIDSDFVRTARASGVRGADLIFGQIARNVAVPLLTVIGLQFGWMLGGTVLVEVIYSWPGLGTYIYNSISELDFNPVIISALVLAVAFVVINLIVDLLQFAIDPRVRKS